MFNKKFGKVENFKLNPKTKIAEFKFFNLESAKKVPITHRKSICI